MPRLKKPSLKQKRYAKAYIKHKGNGTKAALEVYDTDYNNAKTIAYQNNKKPAVLEEIRRVEQHLEEKGITLDYLAEKSKQVLDMIDDKDPKTIGVATNHLNFAYKLHNSLPMNKSVSTKLNIKYNATPENINLIKENLTKSNAITQSLLSDLSST